MYTKLIHTFFYKMDEDKNKDENEKEELIGDKELKVETTATSLIWPEQIGQELLIN